MENKSTQLELGDTAANVLIYIFISVEIDSHHEKR